MVPSVPDLSRRARGQWGEDLAAAHYRRVGYTVLDRNWRCTTGELDLVARRGTTVVFCEVKARRTDGFGGPAAAVDGRRTDGRDGDFPGSRGARQLWALAVGPR